MTRTYIFGWQMEEGKVGRMAINVRLDKMDHQQAASEKALEVATDKAEELGFNIPQLLYEAGVPDIRIILEGGEVVGVYYRNSETPPSITISDLDYSNNPDRDGDRLLEEMACEGFVNTPFFLHPNER